MQREASDKEKKKESPTFKDNDFVKDNVKIFLDDDTRNDFLTKLKSDVEVSEKCVYFLTVQYPFPRS